MMLVNASRAAIRLSRVPLQARSVHIENHVGANMPFKYTDVKKSSLGFKVAVFMISGFSIPFVAAWYQRKKAGGGDAA